MVVLATNLLAKIADLIEVVEVPGRLVGTFQEGRTLLTIPAGGDPCNLFRDMSECRLYEGDG